MADTKTISVKGIPEELWNQFRAKAVAEGENVGDALAKLLKESLRKPAATASR